MILAHGRNTVNPALFPQKAQALRLWDGGTRMALLNPAPGQYVWDKLDAHLAASEAAGLRSIYVFGSTPSWAAVPTTGQAGIIDATSNRPMDPVALANFVDALMAHCGSRLWAIETWNEWNAPVFWIGSLAQLAEQQYIIYSHAKKANPNILVTTPTPCYAPKCQYPSVDVAMDAWLQLGFPADVITFHGYNDITQPPAPQVSSTIAALRAVAAKYGMSALQLWDTEFGPGAIANFPTPGAQRLWAFDSLITRQQANLDLACWYLWDHPTNGSCVDRTTGAITPSGQAILDYISVRG